MANPVVSRTRGRIGVAGALYEKVVTKTASFTCAASDHGTLFLLTPTHASISIIATLPLTQKGLTLSFMNQLNVTAGVGHAISPNAANKINGGTVDKDLINSQATDAVGDTVTIIGDGDVGWFAVSRFGTWAAEA